MKHKIYTLVFVKRQNEILLGLKARGFGVGLWNGFGGKVEIGESICDGAKRELKEESNLEVDILKHIGIVSYEDENDLCKSIVHVFTADVIRGQLKSSEEMNPIKWYNFQDVPYQKMWPDARLWYPYMLQDKCFLAFIKYGADEKIKDKRIVSSNTTEIKNMLKTYHPVVTLTIYIHNYLQ